MSLLRRGELRVGLCRDRLVLPRSVLPTAGFGVNELKELAAKSRVAVILSNHLVRYTVLPWLSSLSSGEEWLSYARHAFDSTYGAMAARWRIRVCGTGYRQPRVASAVDEDLLQPLEALAGVVSIQPYLMAAFNSRRRTLHGKTTWFVLQEPGRLTLTLFAKGAWKRVRTCQATNDWRGCLADLLDRESAGCDEPDCESAALCSEEELSGTVGRYRIQDITLRRGDSPDARQHVMALH